MGEKESNPILSPYSTSQPKYLWQKAIIINTNHEIGVLILVNQMFIWQKMISNVKFKWGWHPNLRSITRGTCFTVTSISVSRVNTSIIYEVIIIHSPWTLVIILQHSKRQNNMNKESFHHSMKTWFTMSKLQNSLSRVQPNKERSVALSILCMIKHMKSYKPYGINPDIDLHSQRVSGTARKIWKHKLASKFGIKVH